ncbi:hypothetical protein FEM48_Zijuj09G0133700 [Ziziphus jujuba var. spinosa]|uniref:QWRF motif-containing protein 2 n=1 Tax=Ziziphus jujuba var. spinosa TaxID=714518 RepID=A0A978UT89_ZIZJJ|nr:hypothetical protein FEM48_Zijuj09G0133700 [Ziziphus jujuba var. spinosa]
MMVVAAISEAASSDPAAAAANNGKTSSHQQDRQTHLRNPSRPPLLPSEKDNGVLQRRPRGRQVSSRYMSPSSSTSTSTSTTTTTTTTTSSSSSSRRCPSPLLSRSTNSTLASSTTTPLSSSASKRSQSVDRRRPMTAPRPTTPLPESRQGNAGGGGEVSAAAKLLVTSTRSLSVSFQGEAFSLPISKTKAAATPSLSAARKATPERRRSTPVRGGGGDQVENSKPADQHRWPARARQGISVGSNPLSRSLDYSADKRPNGFGSGIVARALQQSMIDESRRASFDGRFSLDLGSNNAVQQNPDANSVNESSLPSDLTASDTDSVSSGSTSGVQDSGGVSKNRTTGTRGIVVSARFWQETNSRLRRLQDPGSPLSTSPVSRMGAPAKFVGSKKYAGDNSLSSPRTMASPIRGAARPASPSKLWTSSSSSSSSSPSRGISSPSRMRNGLAGSLNSSYLGSTPSILSFSVDIRRGKMGEDRIVDAHMLRLLYNRYLQWRFVNARADATFMVQKLNAEKNLWNAWVTISELRHSVTLKRIKLLLVRQKLKLTSILKGQYEHPVPMLLEKFYSPEISFLEEWSLLDRDHSSSLLGATEALKASTLRLPVVGRTVADIQNLKDAVSSAVDVMQAMASSICSLSLKVEEVNTLVAELVKVTAKERIMLEQCQEFLSTIAAMQVSEAAC